MGILAVVAVYVLYRVSKQPFLKKGWGEWLIIPMAVLGGMCIIYVGAILAMAKI